MIVVMLESADESEIQTRKLAEGNIISKEGSSSGGTDDAHEQLQQQKDHPDARENQFLFSPPQSRF